MTRTAGSGAERTQERRTLGGSSAAATVEVRPKGRTIRSTADTTDSAVARLAPSRWTQPLGRLVAVASVVFTVGTALHNFAVIDVAVIEEMMRRAGSGQDAAEGFTTGFRAVGTLYIVGNALGILAWWIRPGWLYWVVLAVNLTQGLGWVMIPPDMWSVANDRYGVVGVLPSAVTDGGAALLTVILVVALVRYRHTWARTDREEIEVTQG